MKEMIFNTATGITFLLVLTLPLFTLWAAHDSSEAKKKKSNQTANSILEFPVIVDSYDQNHLDHLQNMNRELNGLVTVFAVPNTK